MGRAKRWRGLDRELITTWIDFIDSCMMRYLDDLPQKKLKPPDYVKLSELNSLLTNDEEKKVVVRWEMGDGDTRETDGETKDT